jgi:hypothetical protein
MNRRCEGVVGICKRYGLHLHSDRVVGLNDIPRNCNLDVALVVREREREGVVVSHQQVKGWGVGCAISPSCLFSYFGACPRRPSLRPGSPRPTPGALLHSDHELEVGIRQPGDPEHRHAVAGVEVDDAVEDVVTVRIDDFDSQVAKMTAKGY